MLIPHVNLKQQVTSSSIFALFFIFMRHNSSLVLSSYIFYFRQKDPIKVPILTLLSALVKICQIPYVIFQASLFNVTKDNCSVYTINNMHLLKRSPLKWKSDTSECSGQNFSNSSCQFWSDKLIPLHIFYLYSMSLKVTPLYFFSSNDIYFAQKEHIKMKIFETF